MENFFEMGKAVYMLKIQTSRKKTKKSGCSNVTREFDYKKTMPRNLKQSEADRKMGQLILPWESTIRYPAAAETHGCSATSDAVMGHRI